MEQEQSAKSDDNGEVKAPFRIEEAIGALAMGLICVISILNVIVRYATDVSFAFTEEYSVFLLVIVTFVGAGLAYTNNGHISIAIVVNWLGGRGARVLKFISFLASVSLFAMLVYYGADLTYDEFRFDETSPALGYPTWIYTIWLPLLSLAVLFRIFQVAWIEMRSKG
ncbi:TRAP transporter small permease subunit [Sneathiella chungangensis]|uniref:TRAP transporter small permease protein n=1 Tax=Sneathiella chungangensis TaxID=1418234 RepID=A0A845MFM0_9PROT|nr:TRAP transporter small permease [Sneathiella chungangensis]MZR21824.1 TRAP transporter small permease subunit [Sneathiella chungangensis]